jgi:hypothetical protein
VQHLNRAWYRIPERKNPALKKVCQFSFVHVFSMILVSYIYILKIITIIFSFSEKKTKNVKEAHGEKEML